MSLFLDVRMSAVGGSLASAVSMFHGTGLADYRSLPRAEFAAAIQGRHVLLATHGFNVDRATGIAHLSNWEALLRLDAQTVFVGLLWPGDSRWLFGLDYPEEPRIANAAGRLLAPFLDSQLTAAASISLASHSLGARLVLETVSHMSLPVRRVTLMAGAIDDNCLSQEFKGAAAKVGEISVLASKGDHVLADLFPIGNFLALIFAEGHPWWRSALGRSGPSRPFPNNFQAPFQIPDNWSYGHSDYLKVDAPPAPMFPIPTDVPPNGSAKPAGNAQGWQEAWSAAFTRSRWR